MGNTRIPDGGGSPRIDPNTTVNNEVRQPDGNKATTGDGVDTHPTPETGGGSSVASSDVSSVLLNRGRDAPLAGPGDASAREAIDTLSALLGNKPQSAIGERALEALEALGHVETVDRSVLVDLRQRADSMRADMAALEKVDAKIETAKDEAGSLGARIGSWFGGDAKAEAEKRLAELRKERSVISKRLGEEPAARLEKVENEIAAIRETSCGLIKVEPSAAPFLEVLETEPRISSIRDFAIRFTAFQAGIDEVAAIEKQVFDEVSHCGDTESSFYALVSHETGATVDEIDALHTWLWDQVDECGQRATGILGATALMTSKTREELEADYRFIYDDNDHCGDTAAATLVYACAVTGASPERARELFRDFYDNTEKCADEASAVLTLVALKYGGEVEEIRSIYRSIYDPTDSAGDVASAVMVLEKMAGRADVAELRADFRSIYDNTRNCGDYESVLLGRAARRTDLSPELWRQVYGNINASRPDLQDSASSLIAAGAASKLTNPEDRQNLLELGVMALAGREDEIDDDARDRSSSSGGSSYSSGGYSSDDGNDFNFGFGNGWGLGYKGYGYYTSGFKIL